MCMHSGKLAALQGRTRCDKTRASKTPGSRVKLVAKCCKEGEVATPLLKTKLYIPPSGQSWCRARA